MNAVQVIAGIISSIQSNDSPPITLSFFYGSDAEKNLQGDSETFPTVFMDFPFDSQFEIKQTGYIVEKNPVNLFFCDKVAQDATPQQHLVAIMEMTEFAKRFLIKIQSNEYINGFDIIEGKGVQNLFDVNVSGLLLSLVIEFKNTDSGC